MRQGTILQINVSQGGLPKRQVSGGLITSLGLEGDGHAHPLIHGGQLKAILLLAAETVDQLIGRGYPVFYGALGENLTTSGIDLGQLRIGDRLRAGGAVLEITSPRGPCSALDVYSDTLKYEIYDKRVKARDHTSPRWGLSGLYARVLQEGPVVPGDIIAIESAL